MIKIIVVEDQELICSAISALLNIDPFIQVVAQANNGQIGLEQVKKFKPDLVLTDIEMPIMTGIELVEKITQDYPKISTIIMTTFSRVGYIRRAMLAGAKGFILKEAPSDELISAIKKVMSGQKVIDPELAISALDDKDPLSDKERKALRLAGEGLATAKISQQLFLSEGTVRNYLSAAINKLNATNRIDAARIARQKGWL